MQLVLKDTVGCGALEEVGAELAQLLDVALANAHSSFRTEHNVSMADPLTVREKAEFDATLAADLIRQAAAPKQGPLSDAYLSGRKGNDKEEKAAASAVQQPRQLLAKMLNGAAEQSKVFSSAPEVLEESASSLCDDYLGVIARSLSQRAANNSDYAAGKHPNLDKLMEKFTQ